MAKYEKGRDWAFVIYPDSLPSNYLEILEETHIQMAISPLHDKDVNPDKTKKKPHFHVLIRYEGPTTINAVKRISESVNGTIPIKIDSARGMYRYHIHIDNPEKYQYDDRDRLLLNGFDTTSLDKFTEMEMDKYENEIIGFIEDNDICEYYMLLKLLKENEYYNLLYVAKKRTLMLNAFIKSKKYLSK